jgi:hypothetical protein
MSPYVVLTILTVAVWISIGVVLSIVMGRRGHISMRWAALGATLGPLAVVAALWSSRHEEGEQPLLFAPAMPLGGRVDVLVGIDGSVECGAALEKAVAVGGYDVLVVGSRGRGLTKAVQGSTASALADGCPVPALIVGAGGRTASVAA